MSCKGGPRRTISLLGSALKPSKVVQDPTTAGQLALSWAALEDLSNVDYWGQSSSVASGSLGADEAVMCLCGLY